MKLPIALLLLSTSILSTLMSQDFSCAQEKSFDPGFDHDEFWNFHQRRIHTRSITTVPIQIHIVRHNEGTGGFDPDLIPETIDSVNALFTGSGLRFEPCGDINFVNRSILYDFDRSLYLDTLVTYNEENVINIYYINKVLDDDDALCGFASFPWRDQEYVVVKNSCSLNGSTLAHEIGHYLGLYHTHETFTGIESVDGSNCKFAGDELCDTPADPRLSSRNVNSDCEYIGTDRDFNRDLYAPDPNNVMSYSRKACRTHFSEEQLSRALFYLGKDRDHLLCEKQVTQSSQAHLIPATLFPVPVTNHLEWRIQDDLNLQSVTISGADGRVWMQSNPTSNQLDVSTLPAGLYIITLEYPLKRAIQKFIKR